MFISTRCQIGIYPTDDTPLDEPEILLYKHSDGYPEGVLPDLVPFLKDFSEKRGLDDTEYLGAWLMYHLIEKHVQLMLEIRKAHVERTKSNDSHIPESGKDYLGHGICGDKELHGDIEYYYRITPTAVHVYSTDGGGYKGMILEQTVPLE